MKTTLVFDYDGSLASIGGDEVLKRTFGILPIRINKGLDQTRTIVKKLVKPVRTLLSHPLIESETIESDGYSLSERCSELNLDCLVFDTISALGFQERLQIKHKRKIDTLDLRSWGMYGDNINTFVYNICSLPIKTIFNVHIDRDRDVGEEIIEYPALKGNSKNEIQRHFDLILFTRVTLNPKTKESSFYWQTKPEEGRYAKDRLNVLPAMIPQDFGYVFDQYEKAGIKHPNVLILGDSGTGKSRALVTINKPQQQLRKAS